MSDGASRALERVVLAALRSARVGAVSVQSKNHPIFDRRTPVVRLVTQLAKGADTIVARALLALRQDDPDVFELQAILPFERETYKCDFHLPNQDQPDDAAIQEFEELLEEANRAGRAFCMAGDRSSRRAGWRVTRPQAAWFSSKAIY